MTIPSPSLADLRAELRQHLVVLAVILNDTYGPPALRSVLATGQAMDDDAVAAFDVDGTRLGAFLAEACDYAYRGKLTDAVEAELNAGPNRFDVLADLTAMLERSELADELWNDYGRDGTFARGGLRQMVELARARTTFDAGEALDARQLALLAGMTERSVQNAFSLEGRQQLRAARKDGRFVVAAAEARRWLADRRGFAPTQRVSFQVDDARPASLATGAELRAYLRVAAGKLGGTAAAAARIGIAPEELEGILAGSTSPALARVRRIAAGLGLDEGWLLLQVMQLDFPEETALLKDALRGP